MKRQRLKAGNLIELRRKVTENKGEVYLADSERKWNE
jgi:hypothetical protein